MKAMSVSQVAKLYNVSPRKMKGEIALLKKRLKLMFNVEKDRIIFPSDLKKIFDDETGLGNPVEPKSL
jgi:hypothetical protein